MKLSERASPLGWVSGSEGRSDGSTLLLGGVRASLLLTAGWGWPLRSVKRQKAGPRKELQVSRRFSESQAFLVYIERNDVSQSPYDGKEVRRVCVGGGPAGPSSLICEMGLMTFFLHQLSGPFFLPAR